MANKDGLEPGAQVDFKELQRIRREHQQQVKAEKSRRKPNRRTPKEKASAELDEILESNKTKASKGSTSEE